jgi:hypothetical protein
MKSLVAALLIVSSSSFAQTFDARTALLNILKPGSYYGVTPNGSSCNVSIYDNSDSLEVVANANGVTKRSLIPARDTFHAVWGQRSYLHTSKDGYVESILRTVMVEKNKQYVVVSELYVNNRESTETAVECIVNYKSFPF